MTPTALLALLLAVEPTDRDWKWLSEHRETAFETWMPVESQPGSYVAFRSYRDLYQDVPEEYFLIRDMGSSFEGVVIKPEGSSVQRQLLEAYMAHREEPFESIVKAIKIRQARVRSAECPALDAAMAALERLRFGMPDRQTLILHPEVRRVVVNFVSGHIDAIFYEDDHPLVLWARRTYADLAACGSPAATRCRCC